MIVEPEPTRRTIHPYQPEPDDTEWHVGRDTHWPIDEQLMWCHRKLAEHEHAADEIADAAERARQSVIATIQPDLDQIDDWARDRLAGEQSGAERFRQWISDRLIAERAANPDKTNGRTFPTGKIGTRRQQAVIEFDDQGGRDRFYVWWCDTVWPDMAEGLPLPVDSSPDGIVTWRPNLSIKALQDTGHYQPAPQPDNPGDVWPVVHAPTGELVPGLVMRPEQITVTIDVTN